MGNYSVLLTGASGMLGHHMFSLLSQQPGLDLYTVSRSENTTHQKHIPCDIARLSRFSSVLDELKPNMVIHCAANTDVDLCEMERENTHALHAGTAELIASKKFICRSVYISTDSVFDGAQGGYSEDDKKRPLNFYSETKALAEEHFLNAAHDSYIIRTNMIGYSTPLKKSLFEWALASLRKGERISGYTNVVFNPLYAKTLADLVVSSFLTDHVEKGIYHFGCSDYYSKYDFLKLVATVFGYDDALITPVEAVSDANRALRPLNTTLNIEKAQRRLKIKFPALEQEVQAVYRDFHKNDCKF